MTGIFTSRARSGLRVMSALAGAGALALMGAPAQAALIGTLTYDTQSGVVGPTDPIEIWVTLKLAEDSDALITNEYGNVVSGVTEQTWIDMGVDPAQVGGSYLNVYFGCGGTFTTVCNEGPPYDFFFASPSIPNSDITVLPGGTLTFMLGTFSPSDGPVAPGTYIWYDMGITVTPYDMEGNTFPLPPPDSSWHHDATLFQTCPYTIDGPNPACAFTRTVEGVAAVPEPASWAMMIGGLALVGGAMRRRKRVSVSFA